MDCKQVRKKYELHQQIMTIKDKLNDMNHG